MSNTNFIMTAPFAKVTATDDGGREVWGFATLERVDKSNEIADFDGTLAAVQAWSDEIAKNTGGKSKGNVRVMHQAETGGTVIDWQPGETTIVEDAGEKVVKGIWMGARVPAHKTDVIADIDAGILSAFSMGGSYVKKWLDPALKATRYIPKVSEVSLVDNPCVPGAEFQLVKADTGPWDTQKQAEEGDSVFTAKFTAEALAKAAQIAGISVEQMGTMLGELAKTGVQMPAMENPVDGDGDGDGNKEFPKPNEHATPISQAIAGEQQHEAGIAKSDNGELQKMASPKGSYEELREMLRSAVNTGWNYRSILGTFPEYVIVEDWDADKYYRVPYTLEGDKVTLGDPEEVQMTFDPVAKSMNSILAGLELAKSGASISAENREKLHKAAGHILETCKCDKCMKASGIYAGTDGTNNGEEPQEPISKMTTSDLQKAVGSSFDEALQKANVVTQDGLAKFVSEVSEMSKAMASVSSIVEGVSKAIEGVDKRVEEFAKAADDRLTAIENAPVLGGPILMEGGATGGMFGKSATSADMTEQEALQKAFDLATDPTTKDVLGRRLALLERKNMR